MNLGGGCTSEPVQLIGQGQSWEFPKRWGLEAALEIVLQVYSAQTTGWIQELKRAVVGSRPLCHAQHLSETAGVLDRDRGPQIDERESLFFLLFCPAQHFDRRHYR